MSTIGDNTIRIHWLKTTDSTNLEAFRNVGDASDKEVWAAEFQTAGRGQRGNVWESARGQNLTFSILFRPDHISPENQFIISQISSYAVVLYLERKGLVAKIKWPNDVYVGDKKICGMLIEHSVSGDRLSVSVSGIGVNLNQTVFESNAPNPTSLALETGKSHDPRQELPELVSILCCLYDSVKDMDPDAVALLDKSYRESMYRLGVFSEFIDTRSGERFRGMILGYDESACLLVKNEKGEVGSFAFKEISYII